MRRPEDFRRDNIKEIFTKRLKDDLVVLCPESIKIQESVQSPVTLVDLSFSKIESGKTSSYRLLECPGEGFVDAIYKACYTEFINNHQSLKNISLVDLSVRPIFEMSRTCSKTDAKADVSLRLKPKRHAMAEFSARSNSIIYSSFQAMLSAFQFYINCDKTFKKLQFVLEDSKSRNRQDITNSCISDLSALATVNAYVQS